MNKPSARRAAILIWAAALFTSIVPPALAHVVGGPANGADEKAVGRMNNEFAVDLYGRLAQQSEGRNVFFSPTSIQTALAMAWVGARGETAGEMAHALRLPGDAAAAADQMGAFLKSLNGGDAERNYQLAVANALWGMKGYPFQPAYVARVDKQFGGHLSELDFATAPDPSRQTINHWVAAQTHDRIRDLMPPGSVTPQTRLVLTNAIYFKGGWEFTFNKGQTREADFTTTAGRKVKAPFMTQMKYLDYAEDEAVQMVELPYGHGDLYMQVIVPKSAVDTAAAQNSPWPVDGLPAYEKGLTAQKLADLSARAAQQEVQISMPRFTVEAGYELQDVLKAMGMRRAFNAGQADFSGMTSAEQMFISAVVHKAFVQVDEEGTEAAAATGIAMAGTAMRAAPQPKVIRADHPFLFAIVHHDSGAILFMGRLASP